MDRTVTKEKTSISFIATSLKGISQVILIENVVTGLIILIAITISSLLLGVIALLSAMLGTLVGIIGGADRYKVNQGLFGFNSVLTGIALVEYIEEPYNYIIALIGAVVAAIFTAALMHLFNKIELPVLTFPFIVVTWLVLLASYKLNVFKISSELEPQSLAHLTLNITGNINWVEGSFRGIGQVFFLTHALAGAILIIAVFIAGWRFGVYAILGNVFALIVAYILGGEHDLILMGLYGYNAILAIIAVSITFNEDLYRKTPVIGLLAACLTVPLMAGISSLLLPFGLPSLTMPFVLSTWIFIGARKVLPKI